MIKKTTQLKNLITSSQLEFLMEAHNGISAKIVEETGFKGIWGSGLTISASLGVRDNNEASWTQVLDVLEFMSDATTIPILLDGDTGYGNFNNMRRLVKKLEQRNVAGVCIEDKLFPKTNSFINGEAQPLADIDEFSHKIKAAKDTQADSDFVVVARIEAFIAGWGLSEAIKRAEAYRKAGADAILVHSKKHDATDIEAFMKEWAGRHPVIIVPTKYYSVPTDHFRNLGISTIIWANHNMRAAIKTMQQTSAQIFKDQSLINVENNVVSVAEVFKLQGADELKLAEKKYLPASGKNINTIILAASQGNLGELTKNQPKTMLKVNGKPILYSQIEAMNKAGIKDISVVTGYKPESIQTTNILKIENKDFVNTNEVFSLFLANEQIKDETIISYGDIIFKQYILDDLILDNHDCIIVVDADYEPKDTYTDFVQATKPYSKQLFGETVDLIKMDSEMPLNKVNGEFIGLWKVSAKGALVLKEILSENKLNLKDLRMKDLFNKMLEKIPVAVRYIRGEWLDIDNIVDLQKASDI